MKQVWSKLGYLVLGLLSFLGIQPASAALTPPPTPQVGEVKPTTPLYLQLGVDRMASLEKELKLVTHYSHWSHNSHASHWAHYSHRAHYSHYNYHR